MLPQSKVILVISDEDVTDGEDLTASCDTLGFDFASFDIFLEGGSTPADNPSTFNLLDCDTSDGSFATVSGFVGDTDWTVPTANTTVATGVKFNVDLLGRKRYLSLAITPTSTVTITAIVNLFRGDEAPINSTKAGVQALVAG